MFEKPLKNLNFYESGTDPKFTFLFHLWTPLPPKDDQNRQIKCITGKTLTIRLSKYVKIKTLSFFSIPGKIANSVKSHVEVLGSKFDIACCIDRILGQVNVNKFGFSLFQFFGYRWERTFQKNFNPIFWIWLLFSVPGPNISKKKG